MGLVFAFLMVPVALAARSLLHQPDTEPSPCPISIRLSSGLMGISAGTYIGFKIQDPPK
jgi:hypothetical protein